MPSQPPSRKHQSTAAISESTNSRVSPRKRKRTASQEPNETKRTKSNSIYDNVANIKVGEAAKDFWIHRGVLCQDSRFFREKLASSETTEGDTQVVIVKEEDPEVFNRFKEWLYCTKITLGSETCKTLAWSTIFAVYVFAERKGIPRLMNACVDTVIKKRREGGLLPGQEDVNPLWKVSAKVFRLRRLLLDLFTTGCNLKDAIAKNRSFHAQFLQGLVQNFYDMKKHKTIYDEVDYWQKRQKYYVDDNEHPIIVD